MAIPTNTRPDRCPNCGSSEVRAHTGPYCHECGEPLFVEQRSRETVAQWTLRHLNRVMRDPESGAEYKIKGLEWTPSNNGFSKKIVVKVKGGGVKYITYSEARRLVLVPRD